MAERIDGVKRGERWPVGSDKDEEERAEEKRNEERSRKEAKLGTQPFVDIKWLHENVGTANDLFLLITSTSPPDFYFVFFFRDIF